MTAPDAYGLAVTGAVLRVSPVDEAVRRRPLPVSRWRELDAARLAWLDGLLAYVRKDPDALARARNALKESSAIFADALEESLAAFATDAAGDRARAARELARLEWDNANVGRPPPLDARYPFLVPINRLVAARWLQETGGDSEAARLLTWSDATQTEWPTPLNVMFGSLGPAAAGWWPTAAEPEGRWSGDGRRIRSVCSAEAPARHAMLMGSSSAVATPRSCFSPRRDSLQWVRWMGRQ